MSTTLPQSTTALHLTVALDPAVLDLLATLERRVGAQTADLTMLRERQDALEAALCARAPTTNATATTVATLTPPLLTADSPAEATRRCRDCDAPILSPRWRPPMCPSCLSKRGAGTRAAKAAARRTLGNGHAAPRRRKGPAGGRLHRRIEHFGPGERHTMLEDYLSGTLASIPRLAAKYQTSAGQMSAMLHAQATAERRYDAFVRQLRRPRGARLAAVAGGAGEAGVPREEP